METGTSNFFCDFSLIRSFLLLGSYKWFGIGLGSSLEWYWLPWYGRLSTVILWWWVGMASLAALCRIFKVKSLIYHCRLWFGPFYPLQSWYLPARSDWSFWGLPMVRGLSYTLFGCWMTLLVNLGGYLWFEIWAIPSLAMDSLDSTLSSVRYFVHPSGLSGFIRILF